MRAELLWQQALDRSQHAAACGALVPLQTNIEDLGQGPFVLRRLLSRTPKHLRAGGPKPNPFLPWDTDLEVGRLGGGHVLLLNKFPVQRGHLLVITAGWKAQSGWLEKADWQAVCAVNGDTSGLWFFNSCPEAGASQPHRHLQLLPRHDSEPNCPLEPLFEQWLSHPDDSARPPWSLALSRRQDPSDVLELETLYRQHCRQLGLGSPGSTPVPRAPYNLLFSDRWLLTVRRRQDHVRGFSLNALGYAGYLLATEDSDLDWLRQSGPWTLLQQAAAP